MKQVWTGAASIFTYLLTDSDEIFSWGSNYYGELARGFAGNTRDLVPLPAVAAPAGVAQVATGFGQACFVLRNGDVRCFGQGTSGQLGDGLRQNSSTPVAPVGISGASQVAAMAYQTCALADGGVFCWGSLAAVDDAGIGSPTSIPVPAIGLERGVTAIAAGDHHYCAIKDGSVYCWGLNVNGEIGDGTATSRFVAVPVLGLDAGVTAIAAGFNHSCAVLWGQAWCWGGNVYRQVTGTSTAQKLYFPVRLDAVGGGVVAIAATDAMTCAVKGPQGNRNVICWGTGPIGDGTSVPMRTQPSYAIGLTGNVQSLACDHTDCYAIIDNELRGWGLNTVGQLGLEPATGAVLVPTPLTSP